MKKLSATFTLLISFLIITAQDRTIEITGERQTDNSVTLSYTKSDAGSYTIVLKFDELTNTSRPHEIHTISDPRGVLLTLKSEDKNKGIVYRYGYRYIRGKFKPKVNKDFCYILPYTAGTGCEVAEAGFANERYFGAQKPADWKSYFFYTSKEEMVTAIRKGVVVEVMDTYDTNDEAEFTTKKNSILIEHEDGTLVMYKGFKKGSFTVKEGDLVFPHDPLGLNAPNSKSGFGISVFIYYLSSIDFESLKGQTLVTPKSLYTIVAPKFTTGENECSTLENRKTYTSFSSDAIITKEMSKRELKKYKER